MNDKTPSEHLTGIRAMLDSGQTVNPAMVILTDFDERLKSLDQRLTALEAPDAARQQGLDWEQRFGNGTYQCGVEFNDPSRELYLSKAWHRTDTILLRVKVDDKELEMPLTSRQLRIHLHNCQTMLNKLEADTDAE